MTHFSTDGVFINSIFADTLRNRHSGLMVCLKLLEDERLSCLSSIGLSLFQKKKKKSSSNENARSVEINMLCCQTLFC